jgi:hypothetical protein
MDASRGMSPKSTAAGAPRGQETGRATVMGGTAVAVAAVPSPSERRSHAEEQQLELKASKERGGASAPSQFHAMRWLV